MTRLSSCKIRYPVETRARSGWGEAGSELSFSVEQLEEANDLLRAESDTAARLRKNHTEMAKSMSQLESLNRELQERSRAIDGEKAQLEKEVLLIQSTLDSERRNYSQGSEEIRELQGEWRRAIQHQNLRLGLESVWSWGDISSLSKTQKKIQLVERVRKKECCGRILT